MILLALAVLAATPEPVPAIESGGARAALAADDHAVFWVEPGEEKIRSLPEGGKPVTFVHGPFDFASLTVDDTHLFWFQRPAGSSARLSLMRMRKDPGSTVFMIAKEVGEFESSLAAGSGVIAWTTSDEVFAMPKMGTKPVRLASGQFHPHDLTVVADSVCWVNAPAPSTEVQRTTGEIFVPQVPVWMEKIGKNITRASALSAHAGAIGCANPTGKGSVRYLSKDPDTWTFATDGATVWFVAGDKLSSVPFGGGTPSTLATFTPIASRPDHLAARGGAVYYTVDGALYGLAPSKPPLKLSDAAEGDYTWSFATSASSAYWIHWSGRVFRAPLIAR